MNFAPKLYETLSKNKLYLQELMRFLVLICFYGLSCSAQVKDSALYQLVSIENDTERVNKIYKAGFELRNSDPELSYQYALSCEQEALKSKSQKHLAKSYNLLGVLYYKKSNYSKALNYQKKSLALNEASGYVYGSAINYTNLGNIYSDIHYDDMAEESYLKAIQIYNHFNNNLQITRCLINIGVLKHHKKQYDVALRQFKEALMYAVDLGEHDMIASCNNNIGAILLDQNKADSALAYLEEGMKMRTLIDNEVELADSYINIAKAYVMLGDFNQANNYLLLAETVCSKYDYSEARLELFEIRSQFYEIQKNFEQALVWNKKYHALKDSLQDIEKELRDTEFLSTESTVRNRYGEKTTGIKSWWLMISIGILGLIIPVYLFKQKR